MDDPTTPQRSSTLRKSGHPWPSGEIGASTGNLRPFSLRSYYLKIKLLLIKDRFEFDPAKSRANVRKHGIGFSEARLLWLDADRLEIPARFLDEPRHVMIGRIAGKHWSAVFTYRGAKIRLISVRRARQEEVAFYEGEGIRQ